MKLHDIAKRLNPLDISWAMRKGRWWIDAPGKSVQPSGAAPGWDNVRGGWTFAGNVNRSLWWTILMPHQKALGGPVEPHVHWQPTTVNVAVVRWAIRYWFLNEQGEVQDAVGTTVNLDVTPSGVAHATHFDEWPMISDPGETLSDLFVAELFRMGAVDANNDTVILKDFDCHVEVDSPGSWEDHVKW